MSLYCQICIRLSGPLGGWELPPEEYLAVTLATRQALGPATAPTPLAASDP